MVITAEVVEEEDCEVVVLGSGLGKCGGASCDCGKRSGTVQSAGVQTPVIISPNGVNVPNEWVTGNVGQMSA